MRYLVTGATGFIGPYLIKRLIDEGHTVRCLIREGREGRLPPISGIEVFTGDITRPDTLVGISHNIDCLFHMATLGHMSNFTGTEELFHAINVQGTVNVMNEARRSGVKKIVHCSTVAAMGICQDNPACEKSPCHPHHAYGRSKLLAEQRVLQMVAENNLPAAIIRFSMVYGPGDPRDILKLTRMVKKGFIPKVGKKPKLTPLIHVEDAVQGLLLAAEKGRDGEIYLITNKESEPFDRLMEIIQDAIGTPKINLPIPEWGALAAAAAIEKIFNLFGKTPPVSRKNIESTLADRVFSIEKAQYELGFNPGINPAQGLQETVLWYKENGWV